MRHMAQPHTLEHEVFVFIYTSLLNVIYSFKQLVLYLYSETIRLL